MAIHVAINSSDKDDLVETQYFSHALINSGCLFAIIKPDAAMASISSNISSGFFLSCSARVVFRIKPSSECIERAMAIQNAYVQGALKKLATGAGFVTTEEV